MDFFTIMGQVAIIFTIIIFGFVGARYNLLSANMNKGFSEFVLNIAIPFTIVSSFQQDIPQKALADGGQIFIFGLLRHILFIIFV